MSESDKYPESSGRRQFVKGVVGSATLVGFGSLGAVSVDALTNRAGAGGGTTEFYGIENTDGPAPRAMPQVVIDIDDEGYIKGHYPSVEEQQVGGETIKIAEEDIGGITYGAEWYQYCGVQGYQGISPDYEGDDYFRYASDPPYEWQKQDVEVGDRVHIDDFSNYETWGNSVGADGIGKPAMVTWRSQDTENTIPVQVIRSTRVEEMASQDDEWLSASTQQGVMAWLNKCTHFCCAPGFKSSEQAERFGGANKVYCPCHQSIYDPFSVVKSAFVAYPRPEDG
ncbi:MAG: ubiquinol-cytochrome c reductase iron-sulfur subunit [Halobacteriaceae archaeon]